MLLDDAPEDHMVSPYRPIALGYLALSFCAVSAIFVNGCAISTVEPPPLESTVRTAAPSAPDNRMLASLYGRYTLMTSALPAEGLQVDE